MHEVEVKGILSGKNGMNIYRGCTHGCIYCDSRSRCYQINHDFEDIEVKVNATALLEDTLSRKRKKCMKMVSPLLSGLAPFFPLLMIQKKISMVS